MNLLECVLIVIPPPIFVPTKLVPLTFADSCPPAGVRAVDVELQSARCLFGEKVKELSVAVAKVDALTRQLEELRSGNTSNSYHVVSGHNGSSLKVNEEYEKLRKELLVSPATFATAVPRDGSPHLFQYRNKLIDDQNSELSFKKSLLSQKKSELVQIDDRIHELQERLAKKKQLNQQQMQAQAAAAAAIIHKSTCHPPLTYSSLRSSIGLTGPKKLLPAHHQLAAVGRQSSSNVAAVEPMQRQHHSSADQTQVSHCTYETWRRQVSIQQRNNRAWAGTTLSQAASSSS